MTDADDQVRGLLGRGRALEDENADLKQRLAFAYREIEYVRERANIQALKTAAPREVERAGLVPVTSAELKAVGTRLRELLGGSAAQDER